MKHAGPGALAQLEPLLDGLRALPALRERKPGIFYRGSAAFAHFHEDPAGLFADIKLGLSGCAGFVRLPVNTTPEQAAALAAARRALGLPAP